MKYIHYGSNKFDINKFEKIKNGDLVSKPVGGLWGSRVDITTGWKDWCKSTGFKRDFKKYFIFSLKEDTKVLTINNNEQLKGLPKRKDNLNALDFEELSKEYDAIEVFVSEDKDLYFSLYGWDCDSIIVMNPSKIVQEENKKILFILILFLLFAIGIGDGVFTKTTNITGKSPINKVTWDVHYENLKVTSGSVEATKEAKIHTGNTTITYEIPLLIPGDFYEFTVDVVNEGTIPAKVSATPTLGGITTAEDVYLNYIVTYVDDSEIEVNDELAVGDKATYKVRVEFDKNISVFQLPNEEKILDLIFAVNYVQK